MTRAQYWILNAASLMLAALIGFEIHSVHQLDDVSLLVQQAQAPLIQAQQQAPLVQRLIQRTALGATRDPALKDLLVKYGITVTPAAASDPPASGAPTAAPSPPSSGNSAANAGPTPQPAAPAQVSASTSAALSP